MGIATVTVSFFVVIFWADISAFTKGQQPGRATTLRNSITVNIRLNKGASEQHCKNGTCRVKGNPGDKGEKGERGPTGPRGEKGERGPTGPRREKGDIGVKGLAGTRGDKGDRGEPGARGANGSKGEKGICDERQLQGLMNKIERLEKEVQKLKSETVKLDSNKKIAHSVLPAGFSEVRVADLQMEALHMAAASACRGSTGTGGSGCCDNRVYPRSTGLSCRQVCARTIHVNCDAELAINGRRVLARSSKDYVGRFYNYGCGDASSNPAFETNIKTSDHIRFSDYSYISFCCCRK